MVSVQYRILISGDTRVKAEAYLEGLRGGYKAGRYLWEGLKGVELDGLGFEEFLEVLVRTKKPQIYAESAVCGDGSDWTHEELSILGDISIAVPVTVYDNGRHQGPEVHPYPFQGTLLYTPGALLRNGQGQTPADWQEVVREGEINPEGYLGLYKRRLLPALHYADQAARQKNRLALITVPGLGCGLFAGEFRGRLGSYLKDALRQILEDHGAAFPHIQAVYYDPYRECENERTEINGIQFLVRPLMQGNQHKPQLCHPSHYEESGDDFSRCDLFSFVAWDHVSWPGNDFYIGSRMTDDGVKAAATDSMWVMSGFEGVYDPYKYEYRPPDGYNTWEEVVLENVVQLAVKGNLLVYP